MWRETKILLIDDEAERRQAVSIILDFLGEAHLACTSADCQPSRETLDSSRQVSCVLVGRGDTRGNSVELLKPVVAWDEMVPLLLLGETAQPEWPVQRSLLKVTNVGTKYRQLPVQLAR